MNASEEDHRKFVGRTRDVQNYLAQIAGGRDEGCVHFVTGNPGVGKTSFVNIMQYVTSFEDPKSRLEGIKFCPAKLITDAQKVQINSDDTSRSLMLKITSSIIHSVIQTYKRKGVDLPQPIRSHHERINELIISKGKPTGGVSIAGTGGSYGGDSQGYEGSSAASVSQLSRIISEIADCTLSQLGMDGIYVLINNLEIANLDTLIKIFNELRDELFSIKSLWIILLGPKGIYSALRSHEHGTRVTEVTRGQESVLAPLSKEEAVEILKIRAELLSVNPNEPVKLPISDSVIRDVYTHCDGEIRFLFNVCDQIVRKVIMEYPSLELIDDDIALAALNPIVAQEVRVDQLSKRQDRLLRAILDEPRRPMNFKGVGCSSAQDFHNQVSELRKKHLVRKREEGRAVFYEATGQAVLAHHCGLI